MSIFKNAGLLITGNEVLSAKTQDTNGPFIGKTLKKIGIPIRASMVCGDDEHDLLDCLSYLAPRCEVIFMTGGLGPTSDDLTAQIVAKFFGVELEFFEEAWQNCVEAYQKFNRPFIPESNKKQAVLPKGAALLANWVGTAVGFKVTGNVKGSVVTVFCMPGVPFEMEPMFLNEVCPHLLQAAFPPVMQTWQVFALGESAMQNAIEEAEQELKTQFTSNAISYQAFPGFVSYGVTLFPTTLEEARRGENFLNSFFIPRLQQAFHKHILYDNDAKPVDYLMQTLLAKGGDLAVIEGSCGGALSKELSSFNGPSKPFIGSRILNSPTVYYTDAKKVAEETCENFVLCLVEGKKTKQARQDELMGLYNIGIFVQKSKIRNFDNLHKKLASFDWNLSENLSKNEMVYFEKEFRVSPRYPHSVQQSYVATHGICSLILLAQEMV